MESMIAKDPNKRTNIEYILGHPIFWDHKKFLGDVSYFLTKPFPSNMELCDKCAAKLGTSFALKTSKGTPVEWFSSFDNTHKPTFPNRYKEVDK